MDLWFNFCMVKMAWILPGLGFLLTNDFLTTR
jgi:hypothetical protein